MTERQKYFLEQFDSSYRTHIIEFSKKLTEISKKYDVLIFLARKAACLADSLETLKMTQFHCTVTSSRVLDMNLRWLKTQRVAIIDDALITGTTINTALRKLNKNEIVNVDVYVLSVDTNWWSKDLVQPQPSYFELNSEQTSLICSNIVKAISIVPRPYTIDYPLFKNIRIKQEEFQDLSSSSNWIVYESTSSHQKRYSIINLTIVPNKATLISFLDSLGLNFNNHSLFKIRLYAIKIGESYWCQIQPIAILPPLREEELSKLYDVVCSLGNPKKLRNWFKSEEGVESFKAKLRLVQYFLGSRIANFWFDELKEKLVGNAILQQDFRNLNLLFSPPITSDIESISNVKDVSFAHADISFEHQEEPTKRMGGDYFNEMSTLYTLSKPFLKLYNDEELKARRLVKEYGKEAFQKEEYKNIIDRLNRGYSIYDLKKFVSDIPSRISTTKVISLFLDLYIDKGAVVPITYLNKGLIYRAYRHGEDVEFAENEIRLCVSMLDKFTQEYGKNDLPRTIVEKLLVLFVRIGIERDFLTLSSNPISEYSSIGIRYYLHGAIVGSFDKKLYDVNFKDSLTNLLQDAGYLERVKSDGRYVLKKKAELSGIEVKGLMVANQVGLVMGNLLKSGKPKITYDDLILMSTCPYVIDVVGALAAEIHIFNGFYAIQKHIYFNKHKHAGKKIFGEIRNQDALKAINSGTWKYTSFMEEKPWKAIEKANDSFEQDLYREVWKSFWPSTGRETSLNGANPLIINLIERLASSLFTFRFMILIIEATFTNSYERFLSSKNHKETNQLLSELKEHLPKFHPSLQNIYDAFCERYKSGLLKKDAAHNYAIERINENYQYGRQLLAEVDVLVSNFGNIEKITYYDHVLVIDFKKFNISKNKVKKVFDKVFHQMQIRAKKEKVFLYEMPEQYSVIKTGTWICAQGKYSRRWMMRLYESLISKLDDNCDFKVTFFFNLDKFHIVRKASSSEYYAPLFWDIARELLKTKFKLFPGNELVYFTASSSNIEGIELELSQELADFSIMKKGEREISIDSPYSLKFNSNHLVKQKRKNINNIMDIGIITIVAEELAAVTDFFKANGTFEELRSNQSARTFYKGVLKDKNGKDLNVITVQTSEQGNRSVISSYNAISEEFNPSMMVLLGIAGSIHEDVNICDVVICDLTIYYEKRAETEKGILHRYDGYKMNALTKELIKRYHHKFKSEEPKFTSAENSPENLFTSYFGPIGTGEAVIKYDESPVRTWLHEVNDKTYAVETEAAGFAQQFYEDELNYSKRAKYILIIRGISDKADIEKKNEYRLAASKNAMKVLQEIIMINELS